MPTGAARNQKHSYKACRPTAHQQHYLCTTSLSLFAFHNFHLSTLIWPGGAASGTGCLSAPPCHCGAIASGPAFLFSAMAGVTNFTWTSLGEIHNFASKNLLKELLIICKADALAMSPNLEECLLSINFQMICKHEHIPLRWDTAASGQTL